MATYQFNWPADCNDSPLGDHETVTTMIFSECVHCGIVEYL